jgi:hypothetical protein
LTALEVVEQLATITSKPTGFLLPTGWINYIADSPERLPRIGQRTTALLEIG